MNMDSMSSIRKHGPADIDLAGRMPPCNEEAEQAVLAALMHYEDMSDEIVARLAPGDFHVPRHAVIYRACLDLLRGGAPVDPRSLAEKLAGAKQLEEAGGAEYLDEIWGQRVSGVHALFFARVVASKSRQRKLINTCARIMTDAYSMPWDQVQAMLDNAVRDVSLLAESGSGGHAVRLCDASVQAGIRARHRALAANPDAGAVPTGYLALDRRLVGGLRPGELWIAAGQTGGGKTSLACGIAYNAAMAGRRVVIYSLEMTDAQIEDRILAATSGIPLTKLRSPAAMTDNDWTVYESALVGLDACDIVIDDTPGISPYAVHARCARMKRDGGLDLVVVDYLQIMGTDGIRAATRELEVAAVSKQLKATAKELAVPVLALCQLNRNATQREDPRPVLSDLRESGAIAQDADGVLFVHRTDDPRNEDGPAVATMEVIIGKQRNGGQGTVRLLFDKSTASLRNAGTAGFVANSLLG